MDGVYFWDETRGYGIPQEVRDSIPEEINNLVYTKHAIEEANKDRYGRIRIPRQVKVSEANVTEVNVIGGAIKYISCRLAHDDYCDLTMIIDLTSNVLVTCWLNNKFDHHETKNMERYTKLTN